MTAALDRTSRVPRRLVLLTLVSALACSTPGPASWDPISTDPAIDAAHPAGMWEGAFTSGGARLNSIAYLAAGPGPHPTAILLHGFPGNERNLDLAQTLRRAGWNAVYFTYRGAWGSGGDFSFANALADVGAVVEQVRAPEWAAAQRVDPARIALVGHSMGGFMALAGGAERSEVACVVSLAGANLGRRAEAAADPESAARTAAVLQAWSEGRLAGTSGRALLDELAASPERFDSTRRVARLANRPVLLVAGARDEVVPLPVLEELQAAFEAAGAVAVRSVVLDSDHAFSDRRIALARAVVDFLEDDCRGVARSAAQ